MQPAEAPGPARPIDAGSRTRHDPVAAALPGAPGGCVWGGPRFARTELPNLTSLEICHDAQLYDPGNWMPETVEARDSIEAEYKVCYTDSFDALMSLQLTCFGVKEPYFLGLPACMHVCEG